VSYLAALLGGSFDPVHRGHVALARLFCDLLHPDELRVIPAGNPYQKTAGLRTTPAQRIAMLELAFHAAGLPMTIDRQEVARAAPSYTVDTLRAVRAELGPDASLVFLMGADQLQHLDTWHDWRALFALAHIGVGARPGYDLAALPAAVAAEITPRLGRPADLHATPAGRVLLADTLAVDASATALRRDLASVGASAASAPDSPIAATVLDYIQHHQLYKN
jgi:nicotinate-nucleotide adenylyltransferase